MHRMLFLVILTYQTLHARFTDYIKPTDTDVIQALYQLMYDTHTILTYHNVPYWIRGGTLLGAIRHQGIVPWDDDLDISITQENASALVSLAPIFRKFGYELHTSGTSIGFRIACSTTLRPEVKHQYPYLDVFATMQREDKIFSASNALSFPACSAWAARGAYPNYLTPTELYPLKKYKFGAFSVYGPQEPMPFLEAAFGHRKFFETACSSGPHINRHKKQIFALEPGDFIPAQPTTLLRPTIDSRLLETGLWEDEEDFIYSLINAKSVVFEWATGSYQKHLAHQAHTFYTVSCHPSWHNHTQQALSSRTRFFFSPLTAEIYGNHRELQKKYVQAIGKTDKDFFDIILIRGAEKARCAQEAIHYVKPNGRVIIDGFTFMKSSEKREILNSYELVKQVHTVALLKMKCRALFSDHLAMKTRGEACDTGQPNWSSDIHWSLYSDLPEVP